MPRSRGPEMPQKQSPRVPLHLKTAAEANSAYRSPRPDDRRSPRSSSLHEVQKKRGTRVADLETKLSNAQEELKKLKEQLASAEAAKTDAQHELEETKKLIPAANVASKEGEEEEEEEEEHVEKAQPVLIEEEQSESNYVEQNLISDSPATDVFEVVVTTDATAIATEPVLEQGEDEGKNEKVEEMKTIIEEEAPESPEVVELKGKIESLIAENECLKKEASAMADAKAREKELGLKVECIENELSESKAKAVKLNEQLEATEKAKLALETDMQKLRVQTGQWRKAAETAAAALTEGGDTEANNRRVTERLNYELFGSPMISEEEERFGGGKRRGTGIRMFGDLWKKKSQQK